MNRDVEEYVNLHVMTLPELVEMVEDFKRLLRDLRARNEYLEALMKQMAQERAARQAEIKPTEYPQQIGIKQLDYGFTVGDYVIRCRVAGDVEIKSLALGKSTAAITDRMAGEFEAGRRAALPVHRKDKTVRKSFDEARAREWARRFANDLARETRGQPYFSIQAWSGPKPRS